MAEFLYEPASELGPVNVGDTVDVINSQGTVAGTQKVRQVGPAVVTTTCGRTWTRSHGEFVSEIRDEKLVSWPFPSIRKQDCSAPTAPGEDR